MFSFNAYCGFINLTKTKFHGTLLAHLAELFM